MRMTVFWPEGLRFATNLRPAVFPKVAKHILHAMRSPPLQEGQSAFTKLAPAVPAGGATSQHDEPSCRGRGDILRVGAQSALSSDRLVTLSAALPVEPPRPLGPTGTRRLLQPSHTGGQGPAGCGPVHIPRAAAPGRSAGVARRPSSEHGRIGVPVASGDPATSGAEGPAAVRSPPVLRSQPAEETFPPTKQPPRQSSSTTAKSLLLVRQDLARTGGTPTPWNMARGEDSGLNVSASARSPPGLLRNAQMRMSESLLATAAEGLAERSHGLCALLAHARGAPNAGCGGGGKAGPSAAGLKKPHALCAARGLGTRSAVSERLRSGEAPPSAFAWGGAATSSPQVRDRPTHPWTPWPFGTHGVGSAVVAVISSFGAWHKRGAIVGCGLRGCRETGLQRVGPGKDLPGKRNKRRSSESA